MNLKEAKELHQKLWNWLTENPRNSKKDWPEWIENGGTVQSVTNYCFACKMSLPRRSSSGCGCPIKWPNGYCGDESSPYTRWRDATDPEERMAAAREIATLPWIEEEELIKIKNGGNYVKIMGDRYPYGLFLEL